MRAVVQRVEHARVGVDGEVVGKIDAGLFVLLGVGKGDNEQKMSLLADKIAKLRIMGDPAGKMNLSVDEAGGSILVVSQFTLYADTGKGNRPSFIKAAAPELAEKLYDQFVETLKEKGLEVATGSFGEYMIIEAKLDGPVTISLEV